MLMLSLSPPLQLLRHSVDMCHTFTSCSECLTSGDPVCGWCPLSGACTRQSNCPSVAPVNSPIWINQASSCPAISMISPEIVYIPDLSVSQPMNQ
jgi:plexin A